VPALAFTADGGCLLSVGYEGSVIVWDRSDWTVARRVATDRRGSLPLAVAPNGGLFALGSEREVTLWSVEDGVLLERMPVGAKGVYGLDFSATGRLLACAAADGRARIWELE